MVLTHSVNEARECIDAFSWGKKESYSQLRTRKVTSHHLYAVERGLRIIELPDGSGSVTAKKTPAKAGYWLWRILLLLPGADNMVAD